jgi:hypothetical protein
MKTRDQHLGFPNDKNVSLGPTLVTKNLKQMWEALQSLHSHARTVPPKDNVANVLGKDRCLDILGNHLCSFSTLHSKVLYLLEQSAT